MRASETIDKHNNENRFHLSTWWHSLELCVHWHVWTWASFTLDKRCSEHAGSQLSGCNPSKARIM